MPNPSLLKDSSGTFQPILKGISVHAFVNSISPKVNAIVRLESELAYYDVAIQHLSHNTRKTPSPLEIASLIHV